MLAVAAMIRFRSCEPLLEPLALSPWLDRIHWIIAGSKSGAGNRSRDAAEWARDQRD